MLTRLIQHWCQALGLSGLLLFLGGPLHPKDDASLDFNGATAVMLADPNRVPSNALMLASFVFLLIGAMFISIWLIVVGFSHFRQPHRGDLPRASPSPG